MKAFALFKKENFCVDLAYVGKLGNHNDGANYLLVHQVLFDRTVAAKRKKTNDSKETVRA